MSVRFQSFSVETHESFPKHIKFFVKTRQSGLPELRPYRKQSAMQSTFEKLEQKEQNTQRVKFSEITIDSCSCFE